MTTSFISTPAGQLNTRAVTNTAYDYSASAASISYTPNGLNQYASVASTTYSCDARGNLTSDGSRSFSYDLEKL